MKKLIMSKPVMALVGSLGTAAAFAEDAAQGKVDATLVTSYITDGQTQIVTVLTAGAAIVGAFFVWSLIKRALKKSS